MMLIAVFLGFVVDRWLGEPVRYHPLVLWSYVVVAVEKLLNRGSRWQGALAWLLVVLVPLVVLHALLQICKALDAHYGLAQVLSVLSAALCLYLSVGWKSLRQHAELVLMALNSDIDTARQAVGRIVSRDTGAMSRLEVIRATIESALENGADAIFAPLFWFIVAGPLAVVAYRLANTLDAMWGYRTLRFEQFGWFSAKVDDVLNWLPARLTALSYALLGQTAMAFRCWQQQAKYCDSPNGGPVMCAGAGSLSVLLGGAAQYHGQWRDKPVMGAGREPVADDIRRAIGLIDRSVYLWLAVLAFIVGVFQYA